MRLTTRIKLQLLMFAVVSLVAGLVMSIGYVSLPSVLFGIGRYDVVVQLPATGGLYPTGNVTYRGLQVGRVKEVRLTDIGVEAVLSLSSDISVPADLDARVQSRSAIGEQYVELTPRGDGGPARLTAGDVITSDRTSVPPDINALLDQVNSGLEAIPRDNVETLVNEGATALAGLGPEISRFVQGSTTLAIDAEANLTALTELIDQAKPVLDTQSETSEAIRSWAADIAAITEQVKVQDAAVSGVLSAGPAAADEGRLLFEQLQPTLPILFANLTSVADVAVTYHPSIEQLLVLLPQAVAILDSAMVPDRFNKSLYKGPFVTFDLNLNIPPPCLTGYLPPSQQRSPAFEDYPDRPGGDVYCRVPQDSAFNVRGARNIPCVNKPGKRAPTAKMCESDEEYIPLNDGYNWKGDPNATLSGQDIPQQRPEAVPPVSAPESEVETLSPPVAFAEYDPNTGTYVAPDGRVYTQSNLAGDGGRPQSWQSLLVPPGS